MENKNYSEYRLSRNDIWNEARHRCIVEMYKRAQPSADYDKLCAHNLELKEQGLEPESFFEHFYLSHEETDYVIKKYIEAYKLKDEFNDDCDIIIRDMDDGCFTNGYDVSNGERTNKKLPPLKETIGEDSAQKVIDFITDRKAFYRFDSELNSFNFSILLGDAPNMDSEPVIKYWKLNGFDIEIDQRHYDENYFWNEENGYLEKDGVYEE